jgi:hypothetical protein
VETLKGIGGYSRVTHELPLGDAHFTLSEGCAVGGLYLSRRPRIALPRALLDVLAIEEEVCGHLLANLLTQGTGQTVMRLEDKLRGKLQDARVVRSGRGEECR